MNIKKYTAEEYLSGAYNENLNKVVAQTLGWKERKAKVWERIVLFGATHVIIDPFGVEWCGYPKFATWAFNLEASHSLIDELTPNEYGIFVYNLRKSVSQIHADPNKNLINLLKAKPVCFCVSYLIARGELK